jgi:uncharacterized RDD family membrane protein YckC
MTITASAPLPGSARVGVPPDQRRLRRIATPEGVELIVELADKGTRAGAFLLDLIFIGLGILVVVLGGLGLTYLMKGWGLALAMLAFFIVRFFYFSYFELRWRGTTPGKRLLGLRVIDRGGGPLVAESVVVRNLMREIEVFGPMSVLLVQAFAPFSAITQLLLFAWSGIFLLMPMFNRDNLRLGDIVAGTMVVTMPKAALLPDLVGAAVAPVQASPGAEVPKTAASAPAAENPYRFSDAQLDFYGIFELQTLEKVLRQDKDNDGVRPQIAERIRRKIGWTGEVPRAETDKFLAAFYAAQRAKLERKMLFGVRRKDKNDRR